MYFEGCGRRRVLACRRQRPGVRQTANLPRSRTIVHLPVPPYPECRSRLCATLCSAGEPGATRKIHAMWGHRFGGEVLTSGSLRVEPLGLACKYCLRLKPQSWLMALGENKCCRCLQNVACCPNIECSKGTNSIFCVAAQSGVPKVLTS